MLSCSLLAQSLVKLLPSLAIAPEGTGWQRLVDDAATWRGVFPVRQRRVLGPNAVSNKANDLILACTAAPYAVGRE